MPEMNITVRNKIATKTDNMAYVCGNSDYVINFAFDGEWDVYDTKTARFAYGGQHTDVVFTGNQCNVPVITNTYAFHVGVFAGDLHTTTAARVPCRKSILCGAGAPEDPTPDVYNQLMARINDLGDVSAVVQSGYNDVVAAISNMFGETETVLCTAMQSEFDERGICLIPSEHEVDISHNPELHFRFKTSSVTDDMLMEDITEHMGEFKIGWRAFGCAGALVLFGCKVTFSADNAAPTLEDYNGICIDTDPARIEQVSVVTVKVKKVPIEYVDTTDIESAIQSITDEVNSL